MALEDKIHLKLSPKAALNIYTFLNHYLERTALVERLNMKISFNEFEKELLDKMTDEQCIAAIKTFNEKLD